VNAATLEYVERFGRYWETSGGNRGQGKILGYLLVCDPPHQSSLQLRENLKLSAGSVSTNTRLLEQLGIVERLTFPSDRATYYRLHPGAWDAVLVEKQTQMALLRRMTNEALALVDGDPDERLTGLVELLDFIDEEYPKFVGLWNARKEGR
jgi:DNA-binding transcriptional regulator GbsR (MarR family)